MNELWKCHICLELRPDAAISVYTTDTSEKYGLPVGTMSQNVRYCNDNPECVDGSKTYSFIERE